MDQLRKFESTYGVVQKALLEKELFRESGFAGPVSLAEALRTDMTSLPDASGRVGQPSTAWWWYTEDFFRPITVSDMRSLLPKEDELDPWKDPAFRMPPVGTPDGRRTLTEFWESLGYETLRKERRSGRLAEKKAFHTGFDIPSAPSDEWLGLPKEFLKDKSNLVEICKDSEIVAKLDELLDDLRDPTTHAAPSTTTAPPSTERFGQMHPLTEMLLDYERDVFSGNCLSIGPDDEVCAEILKLQETLLQQMVSNRRMARRLCKAALKGCKFDRKKAGRKDRLEKEILKCQKVIEAHEKKKKETAKKEAPSEMEADVKPEPKTEVAPPPTAPESTPVAESVQVEPDAVPAKRCVEMCDVCGTRGDASSLLTCGHCGIHVHGECYEPAASVEEGLWRCLPCRIYHERERDFQLKSTGLKSGGALSAECKACPNRGGAYQRTPDSKKLIHTVCRLALENPTLRATAASKRCAACGKAKGRVFRCGGAGCDASVHATCAKKDGRLEIQPTTPETPLRVVTMRCASCVAQPDRGEEAPPAETAPPETQPPTPVGVKRSRGPPVGETSGSRGDDASEEKQATGRGTVRKRGKRRKLAPTPTPRETPKRRGRPKAVLKHRKRPKRDSTPEEASASEEPETRRMTRSMK